MSRSEENAGGGVFSLEERCSDSAAEAQIEHVVLVHILNSIPGFQSQMDAFLEHVSPDPQESQRIYESIEKDVKSVLTTIFPPFTIYNLGSTCTTLQFNSSDFDMHVHFEIRPGKARKCLVKAAEALEKSDLFHSVRDICTARIPIIKFVHVKTGMKCDVNFSYLSGVENSRLMKYFLSLDDKLRAVMLIIKYWGINRGIIIRKKGFTKYSMVMMLIFYLQNRFSFPSVCMLQQATTPSTKHVKWNMNFEPLSNLDGINEIRAVSVVDILIGFFEYYANFKYDTHIICPHLGEVIEKSNFANLEFLLEKFSVQSKHINAIKRLDFKHRICIQDPLELDRNTCYIHADNLARFVSQCSVAADILSQKRDKMFINLISPMEKPDSYLKVCLHMTTGCVESLRKKFPTKSDDDLTQTWFQNTLRYCNKVFEEVFKFDYDSQGHFKMNHSYTVTSPKHLWLNRDKEVEKIGDDLKQYQTNLEREIAVSNFISERCDEDPSTVPPFKCSILITCVVNEKKKSSTMVEVEFIRKTSEELLFEAFTRYMSKYLVFWFYEPKS